MVPEPDVLHPFPLCARLGPLGASSVTRKRTSRRSAGRSIADVLLTSSNGLTTVHVASCSIAVGLKTSRRVSMLSVTPQTGCVCDGKSSEE